MRDRYGISLGFLVAAAGALSWSCVPPPRGAGPTEEGGVQASLPAKSIELDLIGVHDPDSENYNNDCIGCHGDRTNEVALDGVTPTAHSTMLNLGFGEGNDRCIRCHQSGPDFLTQSSANLREQVGVEGAGCVACHGSDADVAFYAD